MLAWDAVVMPEQDRLHAGGQELHIKIKEIYQKGHGEKSARSAEELQRQPLQIHTFSSFVTLRSRPAEPRWTDPAAPRA